MLKIEIGPEDYTIIQSSTYFQEKKNAEKINPFPDFSNRTDAFVTRRYVYLIFFKFIFNRLHFILLFDGSWK